jgi:PKD repeat protein
MVCAQNQKNALTPPPSVMNPPPQAHFSWSNACFGDTTCFVNQSILANTYTWTVAADSLNFFGVHVKYILKKAYNDSILCYYFNKIGSYSVTLTCYDNHYDSITEVISIDTAHAVSFYFFGCRNTFINQSSCASSFYWDFGDGHTSTDVSPIHQYADTGSYNVTLVGYNGTTSDTIKHQIHIATVGFVNPHFTHLVSHDTVYVHGIDSAYGTAYNWTWEDGTYSTGRDTFHVYRDSTANYIVTLFAINSCGALSTSDTIKITLQPPPVPDFSYINTCLGDTTCFINQTIGGITYTWTVGNSTSSPPLFSSANDSNVCFHFPAVGNYSVTLTTNNNYYTKSITKVIAIGTVPIAGFSFIPCSNNFVNSSVCATSFNWDFGDSSHSVQALPNHAYADTGYYQVTLIAYNGSDSSILTQAIHVPATSVANAFFTASVSNDTLRVHATYSGIPAPFYNWNFGDGGHATGKDTLHIYYDSTRFYPVKLTASNLCGVFTHTDTIKTVYYNDKPPAGLDFSNSILTIVPNPVSNTGYIDAFYDSYNTNTYLAQVYNALGQKMFEEKFSFLTGINEFKISSANLSSGVYVLVLQAGNSYIRQKFYVINTP